MKYEDRFMEQKDNMQAPRWSEWAEEAERMDQIAKKEKEEIEAPIRSLGKREQS